MKKTDLIWGILLLVVSCNSSRDSIEIVDFVHYDIHTSLDEVTKLGYIDYDSVRFSDGSYATYKLQGAPQNSLTEFIDNRGRRIATVSNASECYGQVIIYKYDKEDKLTNLVYFTDSDRLDLYDDKKYKEWWYDNTDSTSYYKVFRNRIETIDYEHPDTSFYRQINIAYDKDGMAVKATDVNSGNVIEAPQGYLLDISVEPCVRFWGSDLDGGHFIFKVCVKPKEPIPVEYTMFRYADFVPTLEENYKNKTLARTVLYPNPTYCEHYKETRIMTHENGRNVYTISYDGKSDIIKREWSKGRLLIERRISMYGTTLEKVSYSYSLPSSQVKVIKEVIDYESMTLKKKAEAYTTLSDIGLESDEMQPLKHSYEWENVYE